VRLRIIKTQETVYPFKVQRKMLFWWLTLLESSTQEIAHDEAVARVRGNGTTMCVTRVPPITVVEELTEAF
jgi:hypothetical protein